MLEHLFLFAGEFFHSLPFCFRVKIFINASCARQSIILLVGTNVKLGEEKIYSKKMSRSHAEAPNSIQQGKISRVKISGCKHIQQEMSISAAPVPLCHEITGDEVFFQLSYLPCQSLPLLVSGWARSLAPSLYPFQVENGDWDLDHTCHSRWVGQRDWPSLLLEWAPKRSNRQEDSKSSIQDHF